MPPLFTRTLRLKVCAQAYPWLSAAAVEVNEVFNYFKAASLKRKGVCRNGYRVREAGIESAWAAA
jgi:hypothetical protein